jgi:glycosyltransferase involved in cell wall biosynthesis
MSNELTEDELTGKEVAEQMIADLKSINVVGEEAKDRPDQKTGFERNETNVNSFGGTERMMEQLYRDLPSDLLDKYQIIPSRVRDLKDDKHRVLYLHDLANDPEAANAVDRNGGWSRFHRLVFVSHWQRNQFLNLYPTIPWSRTAVIQNSIDPIPLVDKPKTQINLIYHTTPHRGLKILIPVFKKLREKHPEIHLDVYSSFAIYGWGERDETDVESKMAIEAAKDCEGVTYHGFKPNEEVRKALQNAHIFAYPSIWPETSCIALIEAMSAGCLCVHPDFAALPETAANWTLMYSWHEEIQKHAQQFYNALDVAINVAKAQNEQESFYTSQLMSQKSYVDLFNNWNTKKRHWEAFLKSFAHEELEIKRQFKAFSYEA